MVLNSASSFPQSHAYVLKLHSDSREGRLIGRLEHVASGRTHSFQSAEELIAMLLSDVASLDAASPEVGS